MTLDDILSKFNREDEIYKDILNISIDDTGIYVTNGIIENKDYKYNQNYTLEFDNDAFFINNWTLHGTDKFYNFQDRNTFKSLKIAVKKFIKLNKKESIND